jgi:exosortase/archaeosortase family protein
VQEGNVLLLPQGRVGVADACSGIRSLTACLFAGSFLAAVFLERFWMKILLVALAMALAFITNLLRSVFLTAWAYAYGSEAIEGSLHDTTGYAVLGLTVVGLFVLLPFFNAANWRHGQPVRRSLRPSHVTELSPSLPLLLPVAGIPVRPIPTAMSFAPIRPVCRLSLVVLIQAVLFCSAFAADYDPAPLQAKLADAGDKAAAMVIAEVRAHPKELTQIVQAAVASAPKQAASIVTELLKAFPKEFTAVVTAAILGQPELAKELTEAALASIPDKAADILKAALAVAPEDLQNEVAGAKPPPGRPPGPPTPFPAQPVRPDRISPSQ